MHDKCMLLLVVVALVGSYQSVLSQGLFQHVLFFLEVLPEPVNVFMLLLHCEVGVPGQAN